MPVERQEFAGAAASARPVSGQPGGIPLRYWSAPARDLTAQVHTIIRTTIAQFYVNQAIKRGAERHNVQPGSVTFV